MAVAGLTRAVWPGPVRNSDHYLGGLGVLPFPLRGDADGLPLLELADAADQRGVAEAFGAFTDRWREHDEREERRLAYVAVTRPRRLLLCSGYWWGDGHEAPAWAVGLPGGDPGGLRGRRGRFPGGRLGAGAVAGERESDGRAGAAGAVAGRPARQPPAGDGRGRGDGAQLPHRRRRDRRRAGEACGRGGDGRRGRSGEAGWRRGGRGAGPGGRAAAGRRGAALATRGGSAARRAGAPRRPRRSGARSRCPST